LFVTLAFPEGVVGSLEQLGRYLHRRAGQMRRSEARSSADGSVARR
jgi:hypothetical protein